MRSTYLLAWLSGVSPYHFINAPEKIEPFFQDDHRNDSHCPPPPLHEVFPSDIPRPKPFAAEKITFEGGLTLLKGRVNSLDKIQADSVRGKYEGSLRLSKSAVQLVNTLRREIQDGQLSFRGKRVLELGCGHGLPGIFACLKGASVVHFQDLNAEVLRSITIPNVTANIDLAQSKHASFSDSGKLLTRSIHILKPEVRYYAGDWADMDALLSVASQNSCDRSSEDYLSTANDAFSSPNKQVKDRRQMLGTQACQRAVESGNLEDGYDIILMSETVCSLLSLPKLYNLTMKCLRPHYGVLYLGGKKQYHRLGGGTRQFKSIAEEDGILGAHLVAEFTDSAFSQKEVLKFFFR